MIKIVNIKYTNEYDVYIGRGNSFRCLEKSKWANPFLLEDDSKRIECILKYWNYIVNHSALISNLSELKDKTLGCYCYPKLCHGHVLRYLYEQIIELKKDVIEVEIPDFLK